MARQSRFVLSHLRYWYLNNKIIFCFTGTGGNLENLRNLKKHQHRFDKKYTGVSVWIVNVDTRKNTNRIPTYITKTKTETDLKSIGIVKYFKK